MTNRLFFKQLQDELAYSFKQEGFLKEALTHKSYGNENPKERLRDNERLEFLGDAVLSLVISAHLMERFPDFQEGDLSRLKSIVVSESSLALIARELDLGKYLLLGKGEEQTGGRTKDSILANALEALIAALYLDGGLEGARRFTEKHFAGLIQSLSSGRVALDFKTSIQERCQEKGRPLPQYRVVSETGPAHRKTFEVELWIGGEVWGKREGKNKKEAEQQSAREALERLHKIDTLQS